MFQKCTQSTSQLHSLRNVFQNGFHCYKIRIFAILLSTGLFKKKKKRKRKRKRNYFFLLSLPIFFLLLFCLSHFRISFIPKQSKSPAKIKKPIIARLSSVFMRHINHFVIHFKERTA